MSERDQVANAVLLSVTSSVGVFTAILPPLSDVRKSRGDADMMNDVRLGEVAAAALVVAIGVVGSSMSGSGVPLFAAVVFAGALVWLYESVLAATPKESKNHV